MPKLLFPFIKIPSKGTNFELKTNEYLVRNAGCKPFSRKIFCLKFFSLSLSLFGGPDRARLKEWSLP